MKNKADIKKMIIQLYNRDFSLDDGVLLQMVDDIMDDILNDIEEFEKPLRLATDDEIYNIIQEHILNWMEQSGTIKVNKIIS